MSERITSYPNWTLWLVWIVVSTAAIVAALYFADFVIDLAERAIGPVNEDRLTMPIMGLTAAIGQAVLQWLVLRRYMNHVKRWIPASVAGWFVGIGIVVSAAWLRGMQGYTVSPSDITLAMTLAALGLGIGMMQWLVLRRQISHAGWWVAASVSGWLGVPLVIGPTINNVVEMAAVGAVPAILTGAALVWLLRLPPRIQERIAA